MRNRTRTVRAQTYLPPTQESQQSLVDFANSLASNTTDSAVQARSAKLISPDGKEREIPQEIFELLEQVANALAEGNGVTVAPYGAQLTTQEAADFLGISRPTLVKLLNAGEMAFDTIGRHRRVPLEEVVRYQEQSRARRRSALREMTAIAQEAGMEASPPPVLKRLSEFEG